MGNYRQNDRSGGRRENRGFSGRDSGRTTMHRATCSDCGNDCEVPFKPTGDKPVFCSDCFRGKANTEPRGFSGRSSGKFNSGDKRMHQVVCDKCGNDCEVPFKPTGDKPVFCSDCFGHGDKGKTDNKESKQFELINNKLDKILKALGSTFSEETGEKKKMTEKTVIILPATSGKSNNPNVIKEKKAVSPKKAKTVAVKAKKASIKPASGGKKKK